MPSVIQCSQIVLNVRYVTHIQLESTRNTIFLTCSKELPTNSTWRSRWTVKFVLRKKSVSYALCAEAKVRKMPTQCAVNKEDVT